MDTRQSLPHPEAISLAGLSTCYESDLCKYKIMFAPVNNKTWYLMQDWIERNTVRMKDLAPNCINYVTEMNIPKEKSNCIAAVPDAEFLYQYCLTFPKSVAFGIQFFEQETRGLFQMHAYQLWYDSQSSENAIDNSELLALQRSIDEVIIDYLSENRSEKTRIEIDLKPWPILPTKQEYITDRFIQRIIISVLFLASACPLYLQTLSFWEDERETKGNFNISWRRYLTLNTNLSVFSYYFNWICTFLVLSALQSAWLMLIGYWMNLSVFLAGSVLFVTQFLFNFQFMILATLMVTILGNLATLGSCFLLFVTSLAISVLFSNIFTGYLVYDPLTTPLFQFLLSVFLPGFHYGRMVLDMVERTKRWDDFILEQSRPSELKVTWHDAMKPLTADQLPVYGFGSGGIERQPIVPPVIHGAYWMLGQCMVMLGIVSYLEWHRYRKREIQTCKQFENGKWLEMENLEFHYKRTFNFNNKSVKESDLFIDHLSIESGKCYALIGHNGAFKSTLLQLITGQCQPISGQLRKCPNLKISLCPQHDVLVPWMTVEQHLAAIQMLQYGNHEFELNILQNLDLDRVRQRPVSALSGGMKRRLSLAMAAVEFNPCHPHLLVLDEANSGLDPVHERLIWHFLAFWLKSCNRTIVMTSHRLKECEWLSDEIICMQRGRIQFKGETCTWSRQVLGNSRHSSWQLHWTLMDESVKQALTAHTRQLKDSGIVQSVDEYTVQFESKESRQQNSVAQFLEWLQSQKKCGKLVWELHGPLLTQAMHHLQHDTYSE